MSLQQVLQHGQAHEVGVHRHGVQGAVHQGEAVRQRGAAQRVALGQHLHMPGRLVVCKGSKGDEAAGLMQHNWERAEQGLLQAGAMQCCSDLGAPVDGCLHFSLLCHHAAPAWLHLPCIAP